MAQLLTVCPDAIGVELCRSAAHTPAKTQRPAHDPDHTDEPVAVGRRLGPLDRHEVKRFANALIGHEPSDEHCRVRWRTAAIVTRPPRPLREVAVSADEATLTPLGQVPNQAIVIGSAGSVAGGNWG